MQRPPLSVKTLTMAPGGVETSVFQNTIVPESELVDFSFNRNVYIGAFQPEAEYPFLPIKRHFLFCSFIQNVDRFIQNDYVPALRDILLVQMPYNGMRESLLQLGQTSLR